MSHLLSGVDRVIVFLLGVAALAVGVWALLWAFEVPFARELGDYYDAGVLQSFLDSPWFQVTLGVVAVVAAILGLWLLVANLRRRSFNRMTSPISSDKGTLELSTVTLAQAAADQMAATPGITGVSTQARVDRGRPTITWTVTADPSARVPAIVESVREADADMRSATPGLDVDTRYLLHMRPVSQN